MMNGAMKFQRVSEAAVGVLQSGSGGKFRVAMGDAGEQPGASLEGNGQLAVVRFVRGVFPRTSNRTSVRVFEGELEIVLLASSRSSGSSPAFVEVDRKINAFIDEVFSILCDSRSATFGLSVSEVSNVWLQSIEKERPSLDGNFLIQSATLSVGFRTTEPTPGTVGVMVNDPVLKAELKGEEK